jgi:hypothetical protein
VAAAPAGRAGTRPAEGPGLTSAQLGKSPAFEVGVATEFADLYADQNERDHVALAAAVKSGPVAAEVGL